MNHSSGCVSSSPVRRWRCALLLAALCAFLAAAQGVAQAPSAAPSPQASAVSVTPAGTAPGATDPADFLASLSGGQSPDFLQTTTNSCTSDYQCPPGKLCCRACAFPGCTLRACLTASDGHCPFIP